MKISDDEIEGCLMYIVYIIIALALSGLIGYAR